MSMGMWFATTAGECTPATCWNLTDLPAGTVMLGAFARNVQLGALQAKIPPHQSGR
jgi:hypothetical protein